MPGPYSDADLVARVMVETGRRARHEPLEGVAHPLVVDEKLSRHLQQAMDHVGPGAGTRSRLAHAVAGGQVGFNVAVIEVLHQLDHQNRLLRDDVRHLEARLAALEARDPT